MFFQNTKKSLQDTEVWTNATQVRHIGILKLQNIGTELQASFTMNTGPSISLMSSESALVKADNFVSEII